MTTVARTLRSLPYSLPTVVISIDDLYLTHADQTTLASSHPSNPLVQHRGQPSTHDTQLGVELFDRLARGFPVKIPQYDKSLQNGQGDRVEVSHWEEVNKERQELVQVVILEGWCVGFQPLGQDQIQQIWEDAVNKKEADPNEYNGRLGYNRLEDVLFINESLKNYEKITAQVNSLSSLIDRG